MATKKTMSWLEKHRAMRKRKVAEQHYRIEQKVHIQLHRMTKHIDLDLDPMWNSDDSPPVDLPDVTNGLSDRFS